LIPIKSEDFLTAGATVGY